MIYNNNTVYNKLKNLNDNFTLVLVVLVVYRWIKD